MQEWDTFLLCLKKPLPITFRINGQGKFADRLVAQMESNFLKQFTEEPVVVRLGGRSGAVGYCEQRVAGEHQVRQAQQAHQLLLAGHPAVAMCWVTPLPSNLFPLPRLPSRASA